MPATFTDISQTRRKNKCRLDINSHPLVNFYNHSFHYFSYFGYISGDQIILHGPITTFQKITSYTTYRFDTWDRFSIVCTTFKGLSNYFCYDHYCDFSKCSCIQYKYLSLYVFSSIVTQRIFLQIFSPYSSRNIFSIKSLKSIRYVSLSTFDELLQIIKKYSKLQP